MLRAAALLLLAAVSPARAADAPPIVRVEADPAKGFHWPYYLYVPAKLRAGPADAVRTILVIPANTGQPDDDIAVHDRAARQGAERSRAMVDDLGVVLLRPVFPRPKSDWRLYTHALDRDALLTDKEGLRRLDRQLVAMIDHAGARLKADGIATDRKVLVFGFSASGMFTNRFAFLHPDRVKAAAIGSPGGWPLAPAVDDQGKFLRYPVGVGDIDAVAGKPLDREALARVPLFVFMGDQDTNDSVVFRDSFDEVDESLIGALFGKTPVARWPAAERLYRAALPRAKFKLYPGAAHTVTPAMMADLRAFFAEQLGK